MTPVGDATTLAHAVLDRLLAVGVRHVVVCPGSRSGALALAAYDAERAGRVTLHVRVDERTAGFLALGLAKGGPRDAQGRRTPVPVICTSGTAVANLHPAVLEAAHAGVPLVVVSADRPARLRGTGANQTTEQVGIYGSAAPSYDVATAADLPHRSTLSAVEGPLQLNVQLDEPLLPDAVGSYAPGGTVELRVVGDPGAVDASGLPNDRVVLPHGPRTVVVAGDDAGPAARRLAERAGWPLLAEASSGSRTGQHAILRYRLLLEGPLAARVERVVVLGHPTLSRPVTRLLSREDVEVVSVPPTGRWPRRPHRVDAEAAVVEAEPAPTVDASPWLEEWLAADREIGRRLDALLSEHAGAGLGPHLVAREVAAAVRPGDQLVIGSSQPARDLDLTAPAYPVGERRKVLANRGLAGIDGLVSTSIGIALTRPGAHTYALIGDLTFEHDATALMIGPDEPRPDLTLVVVNDDGGSIFATLEQGAPAYAGAFERVFGTPTGVDLAALCAATRTPHWRVESLPELRQALASPHGGIEVVEVRVDRSGRRALEEQIRGLAENA